jgi:hypothetical protein
MVVTVRNVEASQAHVKSRAGWSELDGFEERLDDGATVTLEMAQRSERIDSAGIARVALEDRLLLGDGLQLAVSIERGLNHLASP